MSATIRYVNGDETVKSTVVILKDGRAMEMRRGEITNWSAPGPGSARLFWPSMDVWASQLGEWPSVIGWRSSLSSLPSPLPSPLPLTISPYLARFLGKADQISSREEIQAALQSYVAYHAWSTCIYLKKKDVKMAIQKYCLDDYMVTLTGLHPEGRYTMRQILNGVLGRQTRPEPEVELEVSELETVQPATVQPATVQGQEQEPPSLLYALGQRDMYISQLTAEVIRLRAVIQSAGMTLLHSVATV